MAKFNGKDFAVNLVEVETGQPVTIQGFQISPPDSPTGQGGFISSPTPMQPVSKISIQVPYTCYPGGKVQETCYNNVTVTAQFYWQSVYNAETQNTPISQEVAYTTGVTNSESETESFSVDIGLSATAGYGPISATLSADFTKSTEKTHVITLSQDTTITNMFGPVPPNTTAQYWQLVQVFQLGNGVSISQNLNYFLALTYSSS